jgi:4-hydroxybenzoyl-CoA thioesterase/acyl-CoA thioester hydrolase
MTDFSLAIRVYIEDTDAGGIVYHSNYLKFMERARTEFMRSLGYGRPALFDGLQFVVHEMQIKYHKPAMLDDELTVCASLEKVSRVRFVMHQSVYRGDSLLVDARVQAACIKSNSKKPAAIPKSMFEKLISHIV